MRLHVRPEPRRIDTRVNHADAAGRHTHAFHESCSESAVGDDGRRIQADASREPAMFARRQRSREVLAMHPGHIAPFPSRQRTGEKGGRAFWQWSCAVDPGGLVPRATADGTGDPEVLPKSCCGTDAPVRSVQLRWYDPDRPIL